LFVVFEVAFNCPASHWPNAWAVCPGCLLFAIGFGSLAVVSSATGVLVTVVVWTFGDMMLFPAMSAHLGDIAPVQQRGAYMGSYSMSLSLALASGPWLGTQLLASTGPIGVWSIMFALGALAAVLMVCGVPHRRPLRVAVAAGS